MSHSSLQGRAGSAATTPTTHVFSGSAAVSGADAYTQSPALTAAQTDVLVVSAILCFALGYLLIEGTRMASWYERLLKYLRVRPVERNHIPRIVR